MTTTITTTPMFAEDELKPVLPEYHVAQAKVNVIDVKQVVNTSPGGFMSSFQALINPYQGCTFGCTYCYAAGTIFTRSPARTADWGNWVDVKNNAGDRVRATSPGLNGKTCYMSSATDPYQPVELQAQVTRSILEALADVHPKVKLVIQTRSPFVTRDLDLFEEIEQAGGRVQVNMTVTTTHEDTRKAFERGCPSAQKRLDAIAEIAQSGIGACITMTPALDLGLSEERDQETLEVLTSAFQNGVHRFIFQPFHIQNQNGQEFGVATRMQAMDIARQVYGLPPDTPERQTKIKYRGAYIDGLRRIMPKLQELGAWVGTNRDGFKPPF